MPLPRPLRTLSCLAALACHAEPAAPARGAWMTGDLAQEPPALLGDVGAYADLASLAPAAEALPYEPAWPLWSSGTDKDRLLYLPEGETIGALGDAWDLPVGAVLVKTFSHDRPLETRLLFRRETGWEYATYVWRADGSDADLQPGNWPSVTVDAGDFAYTVPSRIDCRSCHENAELATGTPVLGLSRWQAPEAVLPLLDDPDAASVVAGRTPEETDALGYFVGNCVHCHDGGDGENSSFDLHPDVAVATTVDQPTETGEGLRVVPGSPEESVLYLVVVAAESVDAGPEMPPLGVDVLDPAAEPVLRAWIEGL